MACNNFNVDVCSKDVNDFGGVVKTCEFQVLLKSVFDWDNIAGYIRSDCDNQFDDKGVKIRMEFRNSYVYSPQETEGTHQIADVTADLLKGIASRLHLANCRKSFEPLSITVIGHKSRA